MRVTVDGQSYNVPDDATAEEIDALTKPKTAALAPPAPAQQGWADKVPGLRSVMNAVSRSSASAKMGSIIGGSGGAVLGGPVLGGAGGAFVGNLAGQVAGQLGDRAGSAYYTPSHSAATTYGAPAEESSWLETLSNSVQGRMPGVVSESGRVRNAPPSGEAPRVEDQPLSLDFGAAGADAATQALIASVLKGVGVGAAKLGHPRAAAFFGATTPAKAPLTGSTRAVQEGAATPALQELDQLGIKSTTAIPNRATALAETAGKNEKISDMAGLDAKPAFDARRLQVPEQAAQNQKLLSAIEQQVPPAPPTAVSPSLPQTVQANAADQVTAKGALGIPPPALPDAKWAAQGVGLHRQGVKQLAGEAQAAQAGRTADVRAAFKDPNAVPEVAGSEPVQGALFHKQVGDSDRKMLDDALSEIAQARSQYAARNLQGTGADYAAEKTGMQAIGGDTSAAPHARFDLPRAHIYAGPGKGMAPDRAAQVIGAVLKQRGLDTANPAMRKVLAGGAEYQAGAGSQYLKEILRDFLARQQGAQK